MNIIILKWIGLSQTKRNNHAIRDDEHTIGAGLAINTSTDSLLYFCFCSLLYLHVALFSCPPLLPFRIQYRQRSHPPAIARTSPPSTGSYVHWYYPISFSRCPTAIGRGGGRASHGTMPLVLPRPSTSRALIRWQYYHLCCQISSKTPWMPDVSMSDDPPFVVSRSRGFNSPGF